MARNSKFRRMLALFMTLVLVLTMMPTNALEVHAGGGYTKEQLKSFVKEVKVSWISGAGTSAKFKVEITLKADAPENVFPGELYAAVGSNISEEALKKGYPSTFYVGQEGSEKQNADGSTTYTYEQGAYFGDDPFMDAKKALNEASQGAYVSKESLSGTEEQQHQAIETIVGIQEDLNNSENGLFQDDLTAAREALKSARSRYNTNKSNLETTMPSENLNKLIKGLDSAEEAMNALKAAQDSVSDEDSEAAKAAAAALEAATAAEEAANALTAAATKEEFTESFTVTDEDNQGTFSNFLGKSWAAIIAARSYCRNAKQALSKENVGKNVVGAIQTANTNLNYAQNTGAEEAKENLESAKALASEASQTEIDKLTGENGAISALEKKIEETKEAVGKLEGEVGIGLAVSETATIGISLFPNKEGYDEIVYIGEVRYKGSSEQIEVVDGEHSLTVSYVMGRNQKGEQLPKPANFKVSDGGNYPEGASYHIVSPVYEGYVADPLEVVGTMGKEDVTVTVTYHCAHLNTSAHYDGLEHWMACDVCGDIVGGVKERHYQNKDNYTYTKNGHTPACGGCDWKSTVEVAHKIKLSQAQVNASQRHWVTCEVCNYEGYEAHSWERMEGYADTVCAAKCACGETYTYPEHKFTKYQPGSAGKHFRVCTICGVREDEEDCNTNEVVYKNATEHDLVCSKCKAVQQTENHGDSLVCQHTGDQFHRTYCKKCKTTIERNIPCKLSEMHKTDEEHWQTCADCGKEYGGAHVYPNTLYKVNMRADISGAGDHLKTVWHWDEVKRCSVCGNEKIIHANVTNEGSGGSTHEKNKNFDTGASPVVRQGDHTMDQLVDQDLGAIVKTDIDNYVMDQFLDIVSENAIDVISLKNANPIFDGVSDNKINVVVQPNVTVTPTAYDGTTKVLAVEINATYNVYLQNKDNTAQEVKVAENKTLHVDKAVEINVVLPTDFGHEGKQVKVKHVHDGKTYYYDATVRKDAGRYYLNFISEHGFSPFTIELVEEQSENDVASVTFTYSKLDGSTAVYKTAYFTSFQDAVIAAGHGDFKDQMSAEQQAECDDCFSALKLLKDVTVNDIIYFGDNAFDLDLNGKTLTVAENGTLDGNCYVCVTSETTPGTFNSTGNLGINLSPWTGDT